MTDKVIKAPIFQYITAAGINSDNQTVVLTFATAQMQKFEIELSSSCAPLTVAITLAELGRLTSMLPVEKRPAQQHIVTKSIHLSMSETGAPGLTLTLETGAELTFEFQPDDLAKLSAKFGELALIADRKSRH